MRRFGHSGCEWVASACLLAAPTAGAQIPAFAAYYQNIGIGIAARDGTPAGALDAERARLMWSPKHGALSLDAAYEHTLWWRDAARTDATGGLLSSTRQGDDWLTLGGTLHDGTHVDWRQRFDRLSVAWSAGAVTATVGRQAISWATTLFLTPADPFVPFDPSDPFREYRTGVDAARVQWFAGAFTVLDAVVRPARTPDGSTITALARAKTEVGGWELSAWGGAIHDRPGAAAGLTRTVAGSAVRAESELRQDSSGHAVARTAVGIDRRFTLADRDLYTVLEYQHDAFGAATPGALASVAVSRAAGQRELQVLGRDESALQVTYQVHPLVSAELLGLWNLRDGSALISPALSISANDETNVRTGLFLGTGPGFAVAGPRSEYGSTPIAGYVGLSVFF